MIGSQGVRLPFFCFLPYHYSIFHARFLHFSEYIFDFLSKSN
nr:MAG TPA: hypothetical protein [Caudoviricetes sp.]